MSSFTAELFWEVARAPISLIVYSLKAYGSRQQNETDITQSAFIVKPCANGRSIACQQPPPPPNIVRGYMLRPFAHPVACWCVLLRVGGSSCAKFETGQTFESTSPNISLVP